jgi:hypothetical protein
MYTSDTSERQPAGQYLLAAVENDGILRLSLVTTYPKQ